MLELTVRTLPGRRSDAEIRDLAREWSAGRVFDFDSIAEQSSRLAPMVFLPVTFGALHDYTPQQLRELFVFAISGRDRTAGRAVDGLPIFFSCQVWNRADAVRAHNLAARMVEMSADLPV
ncbi:MAG: hypothetical protein ACRDNK_15715 [Solirubrobacteraceae bacterium]